MEIINPHNISLDNVLIRGNGKLILSSRCEIRAFTIIEFCEGVLEIGRYSVVGYQSFLQVTGNIFIGQGSLLGPHCVYLASAHPLKKDVSLLKGSMIRSSLKIGDNVWVGANCTLNHGIEIGNNVAIGANSFVNKTVPEKEIWAGSPAKFIKERP